MSFLLFLFSAHQIEQDGELGLNARDLQMMRTCHQHGVTFIPPTPGERRAERQRRHALMRQAIRVVDRFLNANHQGRFALGILNGGLSVPLQSIGLRDRICTFCGALRWRTECISFCCGTRGKVSFLPKFPAPPQRLQELLMGDDEISTTFRKYIRPLNNALTLASLKVKQPQLPGNAFRPSVIIQGKFYIRIGALQPHEGVNPQFCQTYVLDPDAVNTGALRLGNMSLPLSVTRRERDILADLLAELALLLRHHNPYIRDFISAMEIPEAEIDGGSLTINADVRPAGAHERQYNYGMTEISVLLGEAPTGTNVARDIVLRRRGGGLQTISHTHRAHDALHFILLFPLGTDGYNLGLQNNVDRHRNVTAMKFFAYHLQQRHGFSDYVFRAGRLFQEYCCLAFANIEDQRLLYIKRHQMQLRADLYNNVRDTVLAQDVPHDGNIRVGQHVILPATFVGSPRDYHKQYQDAMAIVREYHKPDLFITMTCNSQWPEILESIFPNQTPADRPDIVARVFALKLKCFLEDLTKRGIFGRCVAHIHVIEFQKRGLPHAHILIILHNDSRPRVAADVDEIVCAELPPDPLTFPEGPLREQAARLETHVLTSMVHGPCGNANPNSPCMKNGVCSKGFPKAFSCRTHWDDGLSYPTYRRRSPQDGGRSIVLVNRVVDNSSVVPYSPYVALKYNCHVNVEICASQKAAKYLFKYVYKGADRAMVRMDIPQQQQVVNEVDDYQDMRSIGSCEAVWRINGNLMRDRKPAVHALPVHLPDHQFVFFDENNVHQVVERGPTPTELTAFFEYNAAHPDTNTSYVNFPKIFVFTNHAWHPRITNTNALGRINTIHPLAGDTFYLRMLLNIPHSAGKTSFADLRTVNGVVHETFRDACASLGILMDDGEWHAALRDAAEERLCPQLRELFVTILIFCHPAAPTALFEAHYAEWCDDFVPLIPNVHEDDQVLRCMVLIDIERRLLACDKRISDFNLPNIPDDMRATVERLQNFNFHNISPVIQAEINYDYEQLLETVHVREPLLLESQRAIYDRVVLAVRDNVPLCLFVDARGGTGKTFTLNCILAKVRTLNGPNGPPEVALAVASSGIAATLLDGGRTVHSRFKVPININENSTCSITYQSDTAELIRRAKVIIWDEAPMCHWHILHALHRSLNDVMALHEELPFGGKVVVLAGDFRQLLPVIKKAKRPELVKASLKKWPLWPSFHIMQLIENMRILGNEQADRATLEDFDQFLLDLGNGVYPNTNSEIVLPSAMCLNIRRENAAAIRECQQQLIDWVYPNIGEHLHDHAWLGERAILSVKNQMVDEINLKIIMSLPGELIQCASADSTDAEEDAVAQPVEILNSLSPAGMPPHLLQLKIGIPLILLRNLNPSQGLCNGTRLILTSLINNHTLGVVINSGANRGRTTYIPRITMMPRVGEYYFNWKRRQFPVRPAFSMTINKSQGQTFKRVGVWLEEAVFTHGQLYVAASRVGHPDNIKFAVSKKDDNYATNNIVFHEALS